MKGLYLTVTELPTVKEKAYDSAIAGGDRSGVYFIDCTYGGVSTRRLATEFELPAAVRDTLVTLHELRPGIDEANQAYDARIVEEGAESE